MDFMQVQFLINYTEEKNIKINQSLKLRIIMNQFIYNKN